MGYLNGKKLNSKTLISLEKASYLYKKHVQGAYVRSGSAVLTALIFIIGWRIGTFDDQAIVGMLFAHAYLILMNPPVLWLLKRIRRRRYYEDFSTFISVLEICGYTALIYFAGGVRAGILTLIYAAVISYVGVAATRRITFFIGTFCMFSFDLMVVTEHLGYIPHQNSVWPYYYQWSDVITICLIINVLFGVVAFLAISTGTRIKKHRNDLRERNLELDRSRRELG